MERKIGIVEAIVVGFVCFAAGLFIEAKLSESKTEAVKMAAGGSQDTIDNTVKRDTLPTPRILELGDEERPQKVGSHGDKSRVTFFIVGDVTYMMVEGMKENEIRCYSCDALEVQIKRKMLNYKQEQN